MLERLTIQGVEVPPLYVASTKKDIALARDNGLPFIVWKSGQRDLIKHMLRPALEKMFPDIIWDKVLGRKKFISEIVEVPGGDVKHDDDEASHDPVEDDEHDFAISDHDSESVDIAADERVFDGACGHGHRATCSLQQYMGDINSMVNLDVLQELDLLPQFLGDIATCIRRNLVAPTKWAEGYNKKLGFPLGNFSRSGQLPNLIILDVSGSIPRGIAATMISLIDTLRHQVHADLIITSDISRYYPIDHPLPSPEWIRRRFGLGNESKEFFEILKARIAGKEWGHVISFGDNDTPAYYNLRTNNFMDQTVVHSVRHYHTGLRFRGILLNPNTAEEAKYTGYGKWCNELLSRKPDEVHTDISWCDVIYK